MVMTKRKGHVRKKKVPSILLWVVLPGSMVGVVLLCLYFGFPERSASIFPILYEEIYSSSADLTEQIKTVDYTVYDSLYQSGVPEKNVFFLNVQTRHKNGYVWDFAELLVKCCDNKAMVTLQGNMGRDLAALGQGVRVIKEKETAGKVVCLVSVQDFPTHRIVLSVDSQCQAITDVRPKIAIIIDDLGYNLDRDLSFFQLDLPLSVSVLPYAPFTRSMAKKANELGYELILHLPMEPKNYPSVKPGPGGLFLSMSTHEIRKVLNQDLSQVTGARGVNNHMGSSFTENREKMRVVLNELKRRGLFFIDSRTSKHTVALEVAREIGLPAERRRVFLDNNLAPRALKIQMERLLSMARHRGSAIGICHPYKETYLLLKQYRRRLKNEFHMVPVSDLVN